MGRKTKKKNKKGPGLLGRRKDPRRRKVIGLFFILLSVYLLISFVSYLFTWQVDQDKVLKHSWGLILESDLQVENWLGRLGAVVSSKFIYWGFGVGAFLFVGLFGEFGVRLLMGLRMKPILRHMRFAFLAIVIFSVALEFIFRQSGFSWGGAFGEGVYHWMTNFIGQVGLLLLLIALSVAYFIWLFNPEMKEISVQGFLRNFSWAVSPLAEEGNATGQQEPEGNSWKEDAGEEPGYKPLRPSEVNLDTDAGDTQPSLDLDMPETTVVEMNVKGKKGKRKSESEPGGEQLEIHIGDDTRQKTHIEEDQVEELPPYDPTKELSQYMFPKFDLLHDYTESRLKIDRSELEENKNQIIRTLLNYNIEITKIRATIGPTVTLYEIVPAPGVRISRIKNLEDDIALSLAALGIRIIAPIPGKGTIGIEVPNKKKQIVSFKEVISSEKYKNAKMDLPLALGKTIANEVFVADLAKMPHLLAAGATGQGKSVGINSMLMSLLYRLHPSQVKLVLIDPKKVELFPYAKLLQHYLAIIPGQTEPIVTDTKKVVYTLNSLCIEMDQRYDLLKKGHARNIKEYNTKFIARKLNPNKGHRYMPFIILVIDEFADLIMTAGKEIEMPIGRLAQLARAVGIHLIIATQRPSVNIITGIIKANFPARIAYKVTSKVDSRTILDVGGAEQLVGRGDMLLSVGGGNLIRMQCAFIDTPEVERVIEYIGEQRGYAEPYYLPEYNEDTGIHDASGLKISELDDLFIDAARLIVDNQYGSTSMIQRKLKLGYNRAGRIMDQLEAMGIVGPSEGSKPREVLVYSEMELDKIFEGITT